MTLELIPIAPEDNLFLRRLGHTKLEERFAEIFRETWEKIPVEPRQELRDYFSYNAPPDIAVDMDWPGRRRHTYASWNPLHKTFRFWAPFITHILRWKNSSHLIESLIAHELVHAYRFAAYLDEILGPKDEQEDATLQMACEWGLSDEKLGFFLMLQRNTFAYHERKVLKIQEERAGAEYLWRPE